MASLGPPGVSVKTGDTQVQGVCGRGPSGSHTGLGETDAELLMSHK